MFAGRERDNDSHDLDKSNVKEANSVDTSMGQQIKFFVTLLWRIMRSYSIPAEKIVKMVKVMYSRNECTVIDG